MAHDRPSGLLLALETSGPAGTLALGEIRGRGPEAHIHAVETVAQRRRQAAEVAPAVERTLASAGVSMDALDGLVVGAGPGSFTGVRVAAATAKGLAHALELPLWTVSSLVAGAVGAPTAAEDPVATSSGEGGQAPGPLRYVLFDARGDRVYGACCRVEPDTVHLVVEPHGGTVAEALEEAPPEAVFVGAGARRHRELLEGAGHAVAAEPWGDPTAAALLRVVARAPELVGRAGPQWEPDYLRASNAERAWSG